jgi:hypothetical protein
VKRYRVLFVAVAVLILAALACEGSGGYTVTRRSLGNTGHIEVKIGSVGETKSENLEIDENFDWDTVELDVALEVQSGACRVEFLDEDGNIALTLDAEPGQSAQGSVTLETDGNGKVNYRVVAEDAQEVKIIIDYKKLR